MYKKILVPTDASEFSRRALKTALELARIIQAEVELLHVSYIPQAFWGYPLSYGVTITQEQLEEGGNLALEETLKGIDCSGVTFKQNVESGYPVTKILEEIKKQEIDLVIMGSHGYGPITGPVLGSVSQRVAQRADCPVMIVK